MFITSIFVVLFLSGCGSSVSVYHDLDPSATFDQYKTYSFLRWTDGNIRTISEADRELMRVAIAREIEGMGYTFQAKDADIKIQLTVYFQVPRSRYHHNYGYIGPVYRGRERALSVDLFEGTSKKHVWHSAAVGFVGSTLKDGPDELPSVAAKLFEEYPGKKEI